MTNVQTFDQALRELCGDLGLERMPPELSAAKAQVAMAQDIIKVQKRQELKLKLLEVALELHGQWITAAMQASRGELEVSFEKACASALDGLRLLEGALDEEEADDDD